MTAGGVPAARIALAVAAVAGLGLLAAGCGGGSSSGPAVRSGSTTTTQSAAGGPAAKGDPVAFSRCMRAHGVARFPDPDGSGAIPKVGLEQLGVGSSRFEAAQRACRPLLPSGGQSSPAQVQQVLDALSMFARCVRSRGVSNWPDPLAESDPGEPGTPGFPRDMPGVDQNAPRVERALHACQHLLAGIGYASGGYP